MNSLDFLGLQETVGASIRFKVTKYFGGARRGTGFDVTVGIAAFVFDGPGKTFTGDTSIERGTSAAEVTTDAIIEKTLKREGAPVNEFDRPDQNVTGQHCVSCRTAKFYITHDAVKNGMGNESNILSAGLDILGVFEGAENVISILGSIDEELSLLRERTEMSVAITICADGVKRYRILNAPLVKVVEPVNYRGRPIGRTVTTGARVTTSEGYNAWIEHEFQDIHVGPPR